MLLEWRRRCPAGSMSCSATVRDAAEAARIIAGIASASVNGEYRLIRDGHPPMYVSAAAVRAWRDAGAELPYPLECSLWRRESERVIALEELMGGLRTLLGAAARRGLLPHGAVPALLRMVGLAACDPHAYDDSSHGPLSR